MSAPEPTPAASVARPWRIVSAVGYVGALLPMLMALVLIPDTSRPFRSVVVVLGVGFSSLILALYRLALMLVFTLAEAGGQHD